MADTFAPFFRQQVTSDEATQWLRTLEAADNNMMVDLGFFGILQGAVASQYLTGDLTINVSGAASGYDQLGRRVAWPSTVRLNCAVDYNDADTAVVGAANSRYLSVVARFLRVESDPRTDGNGQPVNYSLQESYELLVFAGSEGTSPTPPALPTNGFLVCDILIAYGQTQILDGDIDTSRRQEVLVTPALASSYADHVAGLDDRHTAAMIDASALNAWADGVTNPSGTVQAKLAAIVDRLRSTVGTGDGAGAKKIGAKTVSGYTYYNLGTTTVEEQLGELLAAINDAYGDFGNASGVAVTSPGSWLDGDSALASPANVQAQFAKIVTDLVSTTASHSGAARIGATATTHLTGSTIQSMLSAAESNVPWKDTVNTFTAEQTFQNLKVTGVVPKVNIPSTTASRWFLDAFFSSGTGLWLDGGTHIESATTGGGYCYIPIDHVPNGVTITQIDVSFEGAAGHGALPASMPKIRLVSITGTTGAFTNESTQADDASASTGAFESAHLLTKSGLSVVVDKTSKRYMIQVASESGANALVGARVWAARVTFNTTYFDYAAG